MPTFTALIKNEKVQVEYTDSDNVMIALYDHVDHKAWGTCGGSGVCGTCLCSVEEGEELFPDPDFSEEDTLEYINIANTRLACQLELEDVPDKKLTITVRDDND